MADFKVRKEQLLKEREKGEARLQALRLEAVKMEMKITQIDGAIMLCDEFIAHEEPEPDGRTESGAVS